MSEYINIYHVYLNIIILYIYTLVLSPWNSVKSQTSFEAIRLGTPAPPRRERPAKPGLEAP